MVSDFVNEEIGHNRSSKSLNPSVQAIRSSTSEMSTMQTPEEDFFHADEGNLMFPDGLSLQTPQEELPRDHLDRRNTATFGRSISNRPRSFRDATSVEQALKKNVAQIKCCSNHFRPCFQNN